MNPTFAHLIRKGHWGATDLELAVATGRPLAYIERLVIRLKTKYPIASCNRRHYLITPRAPVEPLTPVVAYQELLGRLYAAGEKGMTREEMMEGITRRQLSRYIHLINRLPYVTMAFTKGRHYTVAPIPDYWKVRYVVDAMDEYLMVADADVYSGVSAELQLERMVDEGYLAKYASECYQKVPPTFL